MYKDIFSVYRKGLCSVKRASTRFGSAPHKPVLLLTFLEMAETGMISENRIGVTADLVGLLLENWRILVSTSHTADFTQPFYYLQNDRINGRPLWALVPRTGMSIHGHIKSIHTLLTHLDYGRIDETLFSLITESNANRLFRLALLEKYFPETMSRYPARCSSPTPSYQKEFEIPVALK